LEMTGRADVSGPLPDEWRKRWQPLSPVTLPLEWDDPDDLYPPIPRKAEISEKNAQTVEKALYFIRSQRPAR
ncbi:acetoin utilization protein AcuC, partial [Anoxybacillus geothermalis]|nr:acetoin utilization protein AcuC [Anoxybacillus geothermalis]